MKKSVFIITSRINNTHQTQLLQKCTESIRLHHPESDIVVLNDCSNMSIFPKLENVKIENVMYPNCGELNAYVWACNNYKEYEVFIFLHDSTKLKKTIPLEFEKDILFRAIWYSSVCINADSSGPEVNKILEEFNLDVSKYYTEIMNGGGRGGNMVFGAMGMFTNEFARKLSQDTNFVEIAKYFNRRILRCFFERFLYCILASYQDTTKYRDQSLCGCIFSHGNPFKNRLLEDHTANNPYIVKCWQER